ncbi:hypothetical protein, partial [Priestia aryabhattai]|uniref:hypothetical protein n=1 Tax=Priestia aryabhattai TaxID=412384 RepID=UPI001145B89A
MIEQGKTFRHGFSKIEGNLQQGQFDTPLLALRDGLKTLPENLLPIGFAASKALLPLLPQIQTTVSKLAEELGTESSYATPQEIIKLIELSLRVAAAPDVSPQAFIASVWEHGVEQAKELVTSIDNLNALRQKIAPQVFDTVWDTELTQVRHNLAVHTGIFRFANGEWR